MSDYRDWYKSATGQRVTAEEIGDMLKMSRVSATRRLTNDGLNADEIIKVSRALRVNPVMALVDLGHLTHTEAMDFLDNGGKLIETAEDGELALELARRLNPATKAHELDELAARRAVSGRSDSLDDDGTVTKWDDSIPHAADSSPDEDKLREESGEDLID